MLNCRDITKLISRSMDERLSWPQRAAIRFHLLYCKWCWRFAAQLQVMRRAARQYNSQLTDTFGDKLPAEARARIADRLRNVSRGPPSAP